MTFKSPSIAVFILLLLCYFSKFSNCTTLQPIEEISENDLVNLAIAEKPSVILFYSPYSESEPPPLMLEYEKLPQLVSTSPLEVNIVKHQINTFNTLPQGFVINSLPSIKLVIDGASFEYSGPKTAVALLRHIKERFMKGLLTVSSKEKLDNLLGSEKTVLIYFTQSAFCGVDFAGNSRLVRAKRSLRILAERWSSMVRFVLTKDVHEISFIEGFQPPTEGLVLFRKRHPFYVAYPHEDLELDLIDEFLLENAFSRVNVLNRTFYEFFKKEKLAIMLLIANKGDYHLAEKIVNFEQEITDHDILLSVYWNEKEDKDGTRKMLENLIGSARPFEQSQLFILDYSTGKLKFYRLDTAINEETIKNFYLYWRGGMLKPLLRSEYVPPATDLQVQKIVGRNYLSKVMDMQYDVFVLFYFDGCGETCVKILEMIESLATKLEPLRVLKFYRINLSLNDIPTLQLEYLPAFGGYPRNDKKLKVFGDDQISYQKVLQFIYETTGFMTTEQFTKVKEEIDSMYFDSILEDSKREASKMSMISDFDL